MQKPLEAGEGALPGLGQVAGNEEVGPVVGKARREALRPGLGRKAEGALEALMSMVTTQATVRRGGERQRVPSTELVPGDVVMLEAGDRVPAD